MRHDLIAAVSIALSFALAGCVEQTSSPNVNTAVTNRTTTTTTTTSTSAGITNTAGAVIANSESLALIRAAQAGHADIIKQLLVATSPQVVNGHDEDGNTALIEAARFGHNDVVGALLVARADVALTNNVGQTALMLAAEGGHKETVELLKQAGAVK